MKRIFKTAFVLLLIMAFVVSLQAATKTVTQHSRAAAGPGLAKSGFKIIPDLGPVITNEPTIKPIVVINDPNNPPAKLQLGNRENHAAGCVWYRGTNSYCTDGKCKFNNGLRVFFQFKVLPKDFWSLLEFDGDGFVFAVLNWLNNTAVVNGTRIPNRSGGAMADVTGEERPSGELLGYAGPGNTADKRGLIPPKMAVEFDLKQNWLDSGSNFCSDNSRDDDKGGPPYRNHVAVMFWGDNPGGICNDNDDPDRDGMKECYDDNVHGAGGTGTNPINSFYSASNAYDGYYEGPSQTVNSNDWLENGDYWGSSGWNDGRHFARIEIDRVTNTDGTGRYTFRVWIDCGGSACNFTQESYAGNNTVLQLSRVHTSLKNINQTLYDHPQILRVVQLSALDHTAMEDMVFGFCEATGANQQDIVVKDATGFFPRADTIWTVTPLVIPANGSLGTISPATAQRVKDRDYAQFTVKPAAGSKLTSVSGCGGSPIGTDYVDRTYTTGSVTSDCDVTANFAPCNIVIKDGFACKKQEDIARVWIKAYITEDGSPLTSGATVTYKVRYKNASNNWKEAEGELTHKYNGYWGDDINCDCDPNPYTGGSKHCARMGNYTYGSKGDTTVTIKVRKGSSCTVEKTQNLSPW